MTDQHDQPQQDPGHTPAPEPAVVQRVRIHRLAVDLYDYEYAGDDYAVTLTINEDRLIDVIGAAVKRHDGTHKMAGGGIVIEANRIKSDGANHG